MGLVWADLTVLDVRILLQATWAHISFGTGVRIYPLHTTQAANERVKLLRLLQGLLAVLVCVLCCGSVE
jgi:hypothetical protein